MNKLFNKFLVGTLIGTMVLSTAAFAVNTTTDSTDTETNTVESTQSANRGKGFSHLFSKQTGDAENMEQRGQRAQRGSNFENAVETGTLTQEEADSIISFRDEQRLAFQEATSTMTIEEKHTYMDENHPKGSMLDTLVSEGLLTQEQADTLEANAPERSSRTEMQESQGKNGMQRFQRNCDQVTE